jgi:hypothetical protein
MPKSRRDFLVAIEPKMCSEKFYESSKRNYGRYFEEMERANMIHSFGLRDMTAYCFEPFALSWEDCNKSTVSLFPASLIRIIDSMEPLFTAFTTMANGRNVSRSVLYERFVKMISEKRENLHPSIQKSVPKLTEENMGFYPAAVRDSLLDMDILAGMEYVNFNMDILPSAVYSYGFSPEDGEFAELIPRHNRVSIKPAATVYSPENTWNEAMIRASLIPTIDLDITADAIHLLQLVERRYHRVKKISHSRRLFTNYSSEIEAADRVWSMLESVGVKTSETIMKWVVWFVDNNHEISPSRSILLELLSTWSIFMTTREENVNIYAKEDNIVNHITDIFDSCDINIVNMELASKVSPQKVRLKLNKMVKATAENLYKMGPINDDAPEVSNRIRRLISSVGSKVNESDKNCKSTPALEMYWDFVDSHM